MSEKRRVLRPLASTDIEQAITYYRTEAGDDIAAAFVDALEHAVDHIVRMPLSGLSRYAGVVDLDGLRYWPLKRYPFLVFYVEEADHIDIWRVLHASRDIPGSLRHLHLE